MKLRFSYRIALVACLLYPSFALAERLNAEAQMHFDAGVAYVDDPSGSKWEDALTEFRAAYDLCHNWKLLNNIALSALNLERDGEAIEAYKEYLSHGGEKELTPKKRKQIELDIATLSASLVKVTVEVEPPDAVVVDERRNSKGEMIVNRYPVKSGTASLGIHPGHHKISVEATGYVSGNWSFDADPGTKHQQAFKLVPEKQPEPEPAIAPPVAESDAKSTLQPAKAVESRTPTGVYIGLAATGVFAAAATVTGVLAFNKNKEYDQSTDPIEREDLKNSGKPLALISDIGIGAAVLSAGVTAYLYFSAPKSVTPTTGKATFEVIPVATPNTAGIAMTGSF